MGVLVDLLGRKFLHPLAVVDACAHLVTSRETHTNGNTAGQEIWQTTFHYFLILNFLSNGCSKARSFQATTAT